MSDIGIRYKCKVHALSLFSLYVRENSVISLKCLQDLEEKKMRNKASRGNT